MASYKISFTKLTYLDLSPKNKFNTSLYPKYPVYPNTYLEMIEDIDNNTYEIEIENTRTEFPKKIIYSIPIKNPYLLSKLLWQI